MEDRLSRITDRNRNESDQDPMFMHYTIAEDRSGGKDAEYGAILARLGARDRLPIRSAESKVSSLTEADSAEKTLAESDPQVNLHKLQTRRQGIDLVEEGVYVLYGNNDLY